ncbi:hypothetical protein AZA_88786 [Nitrospirillum viridazoti Y2]|nr:hypothetical protein AZA_88786 [Nitrospirillum amazonense Y2]
MDLLALTRRQVDAGEGAQGPDGGARNPRETQVQLHHLIPRHRAGVAHLGIHAQRLARLQRGGRQDRRGIGEGGVAQAMAEGVQRFASEVAVGPPLHAVILERRQAVHARVEGHRQAAGGVVDARQGLADGHAALLPGVPGVDDGVDMGGGPVHRQGRAVHQHQGHGLARGLDRLQQALLLRRHVQAGAVAALEAGNGHRHLLALKRRTDAGHGHHQVGRLGRRHGAVQRIGDHRVPHQADDGALGRRLVDTDGIAAPGLEMQGLHPRRALAVAVLHRLGPLHPQGGVGAAEADVVLARRRHGDEAGPAGGNGGTLHHRGHVSVQVQGAVGADHGRGTAEVGIAPILPLQAWLAIRPAERAGRDGGGRAQEVAARLIDDLGVGEGGADAVQRRHRVDGLAVVVAQQHVHLVGQRAHHGDPLHRGLHRQHAVVLQQHHGLIGQAQGQRHMRR